MSGARRKYLPAEAYRLLVLACLAARPGGASKGELAWETRANHYMMTRVVRELHEAGHVTVAPGEGGGYRIALTAAGRAFHDAHAASARALFREALAAHFRVGRVPPWLRAD